MSAIRAFRTLPRLTPTASSSRRAFSSTPAAANYARMSLIGRLGGAPEQTQTGTGRTVLRYAVATNHGPRDNQQTSWFNVSAFAGETEQDQGRIQYLTGLEKGTLVFVEADSRMGTYEGDDGKKHKALNLVQRTLRVLARPNRPAQEEDPAETAG